VKPRELLASVYERLGIDPYGPMPNARGLDVRVLPAVEDGEKEGGRLTEIM
jgi:hypothetical protein